MAEEPLIDKSVEPSVDDLKTELAALRIERGEFLTTQERLRAVEQEAAGLKAANIKNTQEAALNAAVGKLSFINPTQAALLLREQASQTDYSAEALDNIVQQFAADKSNWYMIRSGLRGGAGNTPSQGVGARPERIDVDLIFGLGSDGNLANKLYRTNKFEYQRLKKVAQERGLI
jgi:hypothetical protein